MSFNFPLGYCPFCGVTIEVYALDYWYGNLIWDSCHTRYCRGNKEEIISTQEGFIITPIDIRDRYIYVRPRKQK